jgi:ribosomal protein L29
VAAIGFELMENERIKEIKEEIAELKAKWPAHSVPPSMWMKLEELEEKLKQAKKELNHNQ